MGRDRTSRCMYYDKKDTADNTLFVCCRWEWEAIRTTADLSNDRRFIANHYIITSKEGWAVVESLLASIMGETKRAKGGVLTVNPLQSYRVFAKWNVVLGMRVLGAELSWDGHYFTHGLLTVSHSTSGASEYGLR